MVELKQLHEDLHTTFSSFKEENDKMQKEIRSQGESSREISTKVDFLNKEISNIQSQIKEVSDEYRKSLSAPAEPEEMRKMNEYKTSFMSYIRYGLGETARAPSMHLRTLSGINDGDGGFLLPQDIDSKILMRAYDMGEVRPVCTQRTTSRDTVRIASLSKPSVTWGRKGLDVSKQDLTAGGLNLEIIDLKALVTIHNDTLDDSEANIEMELIDAFGMALFEAEDDAFIAGTGVDQPQGVLGNASVLSNYVFCGVATALQDSTHNGMDTLVAAMQKLKKTYRRNATWAMNSTTEGVVRILKDTYGQYLWQPNTQIGAPPTLLGRPIINPEGMADIGANAYPIVCGDFSRGYRIYDRQGMYIRRLTERYAEADETGFLIKKRLGGAVVMAEAFVPIKIATS
jgi:phage major capsid protein, HK97 family